MIDEALHYQLMLELEQWEQDQIEELNLELNTVSEYSLTQRVAQKQQSKKVLDFCHNPDIL